MEVCLSKGGQARKDAIALGNLEYTGDLAKRLMEFSSKMEHIYKKLQALVQEKSDDAQRYMKFFGVIDEKLQWYEKAQARCATKHILFPVFCMLIFTDLSIKLLRTI